MSDSLKRMYIVSAEDANGIGTVEVANESYDSTTSVKSEKSSLSSRIKALFQIVTFKLTDAITTDEGQLCPTV